MSDIIEFSKKETELKALSIKKLNAKKKRYYAPNENDDFYKTFTKCLEECNASDMIKKHNVKFSLHYVYPFISKKVWAHITKTTPQFKMYGNTDIIIEVSGSIWELLDQKQKDILIEHELMHLYLTENDEGVLNIQLQDHDLQDFKKIISKYGIEWTEQCDLINSQMIDIEEERKHKAKEAAIASGKLRTRGRPRKNIFPN